MPHTLQSNVPMKARQSAHCSTISVKSTFTVPKKETEKPKIEHQFAYDHLQEQMKEKLGTKVTVKQKENGKGKIEIEFYSGEELERIYDIITRG